MRFDVNRLEARDGRLVVSGHWSGVRGMRFMRPTLIVGGREVLATLEHKPWAPSDELEWTAAFPWDGAAPDPSEAAIAVAPSLTVSLAPGAAPAARRFERPAGATPLQRGPAAEPVAAPEPRPAAVPSAADRLQEQLEDARRRADDARRALAIAERERDQALAQRDEAAKDRDAAVRSRARMERQLAEEAELRVEAERQRDEARAQREEALLAHRALQRRLTGELAASAPAPQEIPSDPDRPIGVRAVPAARAVGPELHRASREHPQRVTRYDVWAIRILGSVAALCFIGFLILLLRLVL